MIDEEEQVTFIIKNGSTSSVSVSNESLYEYFQWNILWYAPKEISIIPMKLNVENVFIL